MVSIAFGQANLGGLKRLTGHAPISKAQISVWPIMCAAKLGRHAFGRGEGQHASIEAIHYGVESFRSGRQRVGLRVCGEVLSIHRVVSVTGGSGLEINFTRFNQSLSACQWMRATTPKVISGWVKNVP